MTTWQLLCLHQWHFLHLHSASAHPLQSLIRPISMRHWPSYCYVGDSVAEYILGEVLADSYLH